ncbi:MAG: hypothetical protein KAW92_05795 [Candidatus Cloacimonetes bacterium]|nr:hypothetical protein [Candidatus Cloacimonadota bacterium]
MVIKRICIFLIFLFFTSQINAQDVQIQEVILPDSSYILEEDTLSIDTLRMPIFQDSLKIKTYTLEEVEKEVRSLEDTFFNFNDKVFLSNSIYRFGNNFYFPPYKQTDFNIFNLKLNNLFLDSNELQSLLFYYNCNKKENNEYGFSGLEINFEPTLSAVKFESGSYNFENKYLNFQKNNFFNLFDAKIFIQSGKNKSPFGDKSYFDNFVFQAEKNFSSHKIRYNYLKLFSTRDGYNFENPWYEIKFGDNYSQKNQTVTHILNMLLFGNFINLSYLHQTGYEKIYNGYFLKNKFVRNQFNLSFHLPIENYETDISLKTDINNYDHFDYKGIVNDYYITLRMNSPGIFSDFYKVKLRNEVYFSGLDDTTYFYPQLYFDFPITEQLSTNLSIGVKGKQYFFPHFGSVLTHKRSKIIYADLSIDYKNQNYKLVLKPFFHKIKNDVQFIWESAAISPEFEEIRKYNEYGADAFGEVCFDYFTIQNKLRLNFNFTKRPDNLVYRPNISLKLLWDIRQDLKHNNFIYVKSELSYLRDFRNIELKKEEDEIFLDVEFGININRFRISLIFKNIMNQDYFMDKNNYINGYGTYLQIHWNFIN